MEEPSCDTTRSTAESSDPNFGCTILSIMRKTLLSVLACVLSVAVTAGATWDDEKEDFAPGGGSVAFINRYRTTPIPADAKISFQEYDWALNEAK